jgi:hypothetical protein
VEPHARLRGLTSSVFCQQSLPPRLLVREGENPGLENCGFEIFRAIEMQLSAVMRTSLRQCRGIARTMVAINNTSRPVACTFTRRMCGKATSGGVAGMDKKGSRAAWTASQVCRNPQNKESLTSTFTFANILKVFICCTSTLALALLINLSELFVFCFYLSASQQGAVPYPAPFHRASRTLLAQVCSASPMPSIATETRNKTSRAVV